MCRLDAGDVRQFQVSSLHNTLGQGSVLLIR
jgi:hypothetical protein